LIFDTTVLIGAERRRQALDQLVADDDDVAIAAVTAAELLVGVELADDRRRPVREAFVADLLSAVTVESYDLAVALDHAVLLAHVRRTGLPRGAHDLLIAATARTRSRTVVTADAEGFRDLPGVDVRRVEED
jgi:tRNA(fMet)-specific endonuclease VapC